MSEPDAHPVPPEGERARHALALSECEDELALRERAARRHQRFALLPGVGVTTFWVTASLLGVGSPAGVLSAIFAIVTAREGKKQYDHQVGLRSCRARLQALRSGAGPEPEEEEPREER